MGTRFIATEEAQAHQNYKSLIAITSEDGTVVTRAHTGKPCRLVRNQFTDSWVGCEDEIAGYPLQALRVGHAASERGRLHGDVENGVLPAGQSAGLIRGVEPAGDVVRRTVDAAVEILQRAGG